MALIYKRWAGATSDSEDELVGPEAFGPAPVHMHDAIFGELSHDDLVGFGRHAGLTYAEAKSRDPAYCRWVLHVHDACGTDLLRFRAYLQLTRDEAAREALQAREQRDRLAKEHALAVNREKVRVALLRRSTARGQVLALFHDPSFVDRALLSRLPFATLVVLPSVCKELSQWRRQERRTWLARLSTAAAEREPDVRKAVGKKALAFLRRAYGIPNGWKVRGLLGGAGLEEGLRLGEVAALRRHEYEERKAHVLASIRAWKAARSSAIISIDNLENSRAIFEAVSNRALELRAATAQLAALLKEFGAKVADVPKGNLTSWHLTELERFCS